MDGRGLKGIVIAESLDQIREHLILVNNLTFQSVRSVLETSADHGIQVFRHDSA